MLAKMQKDDVLLQFKYRLAHCLTKRRMGDFLQALSELDTLLDELIAEQAKVEVGSKKWNRTTRLMVNLLKERLTLQSTMGKMSRAESSFQASIVYQQELYSAAGTPSSPVPAHIKAIMDDFELSEGALNVKIV